jgi:hypothetical protein
MPRRLAATISARSRSFSLIIAFLRLPDSTPFPVTDIEDVYGAFRLVHVEDCAVRFVDELPEVPFEVLPFPGIGAPFWKALQGVKLIVKALKPAGRRSAENVHGCTGRTPGCLLAPPV